MTNELTLSVVSHGHGDLLVDLLEDLRLQAPDIHIVVTFNIPEPGFDRSRWPMVTFRDNAVPKGFGANHNAALANATTHWLVIVNPDIRLTESSFRGFSDAIEACPHVAMWAPLVIGPDGQPQDSARRLPTPFRVFRRALQRLIGGGAVTEPDGRPTWFAGMFLLVRREAFAAVGGFDERYFLYGEDVALSIAMVASGHPIGWTEQSVVVHDARRASLRSWRHFRWHLVSLLRLWLSKDFYLHERRFAVLDVTT